MQDGERSGGVYRLLSLASLYDLAQSAFGATNARRSVVRDYFGSIRGARILDIGCGTAQIASVLDEGIYHGFDPNPSYVEAARESLGKAGRVWQGTIQDPRLPDGEPYEIVHAGGVAHHVDDSAAAQMFQLAFEVLRPGGRVITIDPCVHAGQSLLARTLVRRDRGQYVRSPDEYEQLAAPVFDGARIAVRDELLRIPYSHCVIVGTKPTHM
jgi:SAM-dependent methyltransferase